MRRFKVSGRHEGGATPAGLPARCRICFGLYCAGEPRHESIGYFLNQEFIKDPNRVDVTPAARQLIEELKREHGPIMFHLSGGCCDGSAPMCFQVGEFKLGGVDEKVGEIVGCEFWMDRAQFKLWAHTRWTVDVVPGRGGSFSLEAPRGRRFIIRSDMCAVPPPVTMNAS